MLKSDLKKSFNDLDQSDSRPYRVVIVSKMKNVYMLISDANVTVTGVKNLQQYSHKFDSEIRFITHPSDFFSLS